MQQKSKFSSKLGFVMAAAASAVGLGNLWRFPYLAAKYGGGIFLLIYLILAVTFGFAMMITEVSIGRKTGKSIFDAYGALDKRFSFMGILVFLVPVIITPYYCVVGGWVLHYFMGFLSGEGSAMADSSYFSSFIGKPLEPFFCMLVFLIITALIVALGVEKGIEKFSKLLMPILVVLSLFIAIYVCTRPGAGAGILYYLKPDVSKLSINTVIAAMGQLFYSLSLAMGIMITYGSYMKKEDNIEQSIRQIEVFDTIIAFMAGLIIVPAVYSFSGGDESQLSQGAGLMFVTLPKVFDSMAFGKVIGTLFFLLVVFAALTSSVSLMEALVAVVLEKTKWNRVQATMLVAFFAVIIAIPSVLGYSLWSGVTVLGFQILDFFDFISNSVLMPLVELMTCILIGYVLKTTVIEEEVEKSEKFKAKKLYRSMMKVVAPIILLIILISAVLNAIGIITI